MEAESDMVCGDGGTRRAGGGSGTVDTGLAGWRLATGADAAAIAPLLAPTPMTSPPGVVFPPPGTVPLAARWRKSSSGFGARGIIEAEGGCSFPLPGAGSRTAPTSPVSARSLIDPA